MPAIPNSEADLHRRALAALDDLTALGLWQELATRGNPDAPERLRAYAQSLSPELRDPARETLEAMELSHDEPMD